MLSYEIAHHVPGRIRIRIPVLKKLSLSMLQRSAAIPFEAGILHVQVNPVTGSLVIHYDPQRIDILKYLEAMASNEEIEEIIRAGRKG
jgi:hypothetical protein